METTQKTGIEAVKALAAQSGVCCANCEYSEKSKIDDGDLICNAHSIYRSPTDFCSDFQFKKPEEK